MSRLAELTERLDAIARELEAGEATDERAAELAREAGEVAAEVIEEAGRLAGEAGTDG